MQEKNNLHKYASAFFLHKTSSESTISPELLLTSPDNYRVRINAPSQSFTYHKTDVTQEKEGSPLLKEETETKPLVTDSEPVHKTTETQGVRTPTITLPDSLVTLGNEEKTAFKRVLKFKIPEKKEKAREFTFQPRAPPLTAEENAKPKTRTSISKIFPNRLEVPFDKRESVESNESRSRRNSTMSMNRLSMFKASISTPKIGESSMTFDTFVDKQKGVDTNMESDYPSYKIDKRLIFIGGTIEYPFLVVPNNSTFRKIWNAFIVAFIVYEALLYPLIAVFTQKLSKGLFAIEIVSIFVFLLDIFINTRTTYTDENNEEIVDIKMMREKYIKSSYFILDVITCFPISEILLGVISDSDDAYAMYAIFKLIRLFRLLKVNVYLKNMSLSPVFGLATTFFAFCIMTHWMSSIWYLVIRLQYDENLDVSRLWFPPNLRATLDDPEELSFFYTGLDTLEVYSNVVLAVFMLMMGGDIVPITTIQVCFAMVIGFIGAVTLAYIFGSVTYIISYLNADDTLFRDKLSDLTKKLSINKVPKNLKMKALEYFHYAWRKNSVLQKTNDFSELSIPLQRDLAFFQYQKSIMKVPLFKELEPIEILSIIQKLKTCVYMPGDKIIREGERGNEMFFIQEGKVEIVIKKYAAKSDGQKEALFERICLDKGSYFGEIALISTSKRTSDVNAYEFCILDSFSKADYENLKIEFPDIGPRLKAGLKHYKNNHMNKIIQILGKLPIFEHFNTKELKTVADKYLEEIFINPDRLVLRPKDKINSIYIILLGSVTCYPDRMETRSYLTNLASSSGQQSKPDDVEEPEQNQNCVDDNILDMEKDQLTMNDQKKKLRVIKTYTYGEYFGKLDFEVNNAACRDFYISDSGCQLGTISQALLAKMDVEDPELYEKFKANFLKLPERRDRSSIEDDDEFGGRGSRLAAGVRRRLEKFKSTVVQMRKKKEFANKEQVERVEEKIDKLLGLMEKNETKQKKRLSSQNKMNKIFMKKLAQPKAQRQKSVSMLSIDETLAKRNKLTHIPLKPGSLEKAPASAVRAKIPSLSEKEDDMSRSENEDQTPKETKATKQDQPPSIFSIDNISTKRNRMDQTASFKQDYKLQSLDDKEDPDDKDPALDEKEEDRNENEGEDEAQNRQGEVGTSIF